MSKAQFYLTDIPRELRDALETRARTMGTSVSNIVGEILSARYGLAFEDSGRPLHKRFEADEYVRPNGQAIGHTMNLKLPLAVVEAVRAEANSKRKGYTLAPTTQRQIVLASLAAALDVKLPKPRNRGHGRPRGRMVKTP